MTVQSLAHGEATQGADGAEEMKRGGAGHLHRGT